MGRHTADLSEDRGTRDHLDRPVVGERRAARDRLRTSEHAVIHTAPQAVTASIPAAPESAPARKERTATAGSVPRTVADHRVVAQRRAVTTAARGKAARTAPKRTVGSFMRSRATIPALSFFAVFGFVGGSLFNPMQPDVAQAAVTAPVLVKAPVAPQQYSTHGTYAAFDVSRDEYGVTVPAPKVAAPPVEETDAAATAKQKITPSNAVAPAAATPNPGSAQAIAQELVAARGWGSDQFSCLVSLWNKESGWRVNAYNPSGAYGIPQALPGSKMATVGADWQTNPATQITWGLNYISGVYGTPCAAWGHSQRLNWY